MSSQSTTSTDDAQVRLILQQWASATPKGEKNEILANHSPHVLVYDVLPPMLYEGAEAYRRSWDDWWPDTLGEGVFELQNLSVTASADVAFAHCLIRCGGTLPDGRIFEDVVRATFCLRKSDGLWKVVHSHVSKPYQPAGAKLP